MKRKRERNTSGITTSPYSSREPEIDTVKKMKKAWNSSRRKLLSALLVTEEED
jgi:hypothetical protein